MHPISSHHINPNANSDTHARKCRSETGTRALSLTGAHNLAERTLGHRKANAMGEIQISAWRGAITPSARKQIEKIILKARQLRRGKPAEDPTSQQMQRALREV